MTKIATSPSAALPLVADSSLREAEARYLQAMSVFGVDSAEVKAAWSCWHAARRKARLAAAASGCSE